VLPPGNDVEQAGDLDPEPGLLATLAHCSPGRILIEVNKAGREGPQSLARVHLAADEEHLPLVPNEHARGDFVLAEDDRVTSGTKTSHAAEGFPVFERVTAGGAVVQCRGA